MVWSARRLSMWDLGIYMVRMMIRLMMSTGWITVVGAIGCYEGMYGV